VEQDSSFRAISRERERERERERAGRERADTADAGPTGRQDGTSGTPDRGDGWRAIGVNPGNEDVAGTLPSNAQGGQRTRDIAGAYVCGFSHTQGLDPQATEERTPTLRKNGGGMAAGVGSTVRRLTPLECERLMGFPDGWTDIPWNKKDHAPDSRRYAACGNGVVSPVAYWIGARLAEVLK
jgi:DNA (cytosine-5)-methyltransferase 1